MSRQKFCAKGDLAMRPEAVGLTYPRAPRDDQMRGSVAVIRVCGPLEHHGGWWFDSYESILGRVEGAFMHEDVTAVVLDIDSPGGEVSGLQETVRSIRKMRADHGKPLVAYANDDAYSAAYALACSADEIYLPEGGGVGSIGVLAELQDLTGAAEKAGVRIEVVRSGNRKAEGHPFIPLDDGIISRVQSRIDALADQFFALVCDVRPTKPKQLEAIQGACLYGQDAVDAGLADGVASFDEVLSALSESQFDKSLSSAVSFNPTDRSNGHGASAMFKVLEKKVASALAALTAATNPTARKKAADAYAKAVAALTEAKVKKTYEKKTTETETEEDDGEAVDAADDEDEESASAGEDDDEPDDDDEDASAKKGKKASGLAAFVKSLTGQSNAAAAQQVLASMYEQAQANAANAAKIARLEADAVETKREDVIRAGVAAGQLKPSQIAWAKTQSIKSIKSYLAATPATFAPRQPNPGASDVTEHASGEAVGSDGLSDFERKLCAEQGISPEAFKKVSNGSPILPKVN